ncbi:MAG: hypothetical protein MUD01_20735 [Chloroflexaceae bacterium]|jgi:hypothetical protein|nr:hypothetical protein [Chloroflexaceae bacterium]
MERVSEQTAWYDSQPFDINERVAINDATEQRLAGGNGGRVVGFDASGPRPNEGFIRVLVLVDGRNQIAAVAPWALERELADERAELARTMLLEWRQTLGEANFNRLRAWLHGDECAAFLSDPNFAMKRLRISGITLPGFLIPELVRLSQ